MQVESIADALFVYKKHLESTETIISATQIYDLTLTSLTRYTLPGWGHPAPVGRKPTTIEKEAALTYLANTSVNKLEEALEIQEKVFEGLNATNDQYIKQKYAYTSRLRKFIEWVKQVGLIKGSKELKSNRTEAFHRGHGNTNEKRTTDRKALPTYTLKPKDAPVCLVAEMEQIKKFLVDDIYPGRKFEPLKEDVANKYIKLLYKISGWYISTHSFSGDFSLNLLVPEPKHKRKMNRNEFLDEAEETAEYIEKWICELINFLQTERKNKPASISSMLVPINQLIKYRYLRDTQKNDFKDIPAMDVIRNYLNIFAKKTNKLRQEETFDDSLSWLDLPDVITKIVLPLKNQTNYRNKNYRLRKITTIADSFADFIIWGLFTFRPPRRQQEWRGMKIGLSCSIISDEPPNFPENLVIHPLPLDRDKDLGYGYLYKTVNGKWFKDTPSQSYKTGKTYASQQLEIPNPKFPDGKCFYDYLEAYLYGYYRDKKGNWLSGSQLTYKDLTKRPQQGQWYSLRMAHNPQHNFIFFGSDKVQPYTNSTFENMFSTLANGLTGKMLNPHLLRDIYVTWFLDQGYTQDRIASLAYALGHSVEVLTKIYDRRKPHQKNRPIEEEMGKLIDQFINNTYISDGSSDGSSSSASTPKPTQNDIDRIMAVLTPEQKRQLGFA